jgi:hypothetical protein
MANFSLPPSAPLEFLRIDEIVIHTVGEFGGNIDVIVKAEAQHHGAILDALKATHSDKDRGVRALGTLSRGDVLDLSFHQGALAEMKDPPDTVIFHWEEEWLGTAPCTLATDDVPFPEESADESPKGRYRHWKKGAFTFMEPPGFLLLRLSSFVFAFLGLNFFQRVINQGNEEGMGLVWASIAAAIMLLAIPLHRIRIEKEKSIAVGKGWTLPFIWEAFKAKRVLDLSQCRGVGVQASTCWVVIALRDKNAEAMAVGAGPNVEAARLLAEQVAELSGLPLNPPASPP